MRCSLHLAACLLLAPARLVPQTLEAVPHRVLVDQSASIRAAGLQPGGRVTIQADLRDGGDIRWTSHADFIADAQGTVDTARQPAVAGSYKEVSAMGLVWSMKPSSGRAFRYRPPGQGTQTIEFQLLRGHTKLAAARLEQVPMAAGVERIDVSHGALFLPPGGGRHPGVLVLGGSEGGLPHRRAAWLASHGFAAFALAYFRYADLPRELAGIRLEYFGEALQWMLERPEIDGGPLAVTGVSRGAELALQLGSMYPAIKAVVAYSPADVRYPACCGFMSVPYAWTWNGNPLAFAPIRGRQRYPDLVMRAAIDVERTHGPVVLISGDADGIWDSTGMADSIVARLERHHFPYPVVHLKYAHAGHQAGRPEIVPAWTRPDINPRTGWERDMGGSPQGNAESSLDAPRKVIEFLRQSLGTTRSSP
ncbi:MAG TPA: acyl-CoA thioesterase/bile acid-CoA:amino acid N-acyltransferase family protein [Bryobacteraceae bacterium]|nr:acyl-CoA thioesterase/bile acid-CoA:amino acid N-acyltransferase family protein [Bryobacteraceae bacterium]